MAAGSKEVDRPLYRALTLMFLLSASVIPAERPVAALYQADDTVNGKRAADYQALPLNSAAIVPPLVMLTLSRDHQLHYKAYNDYSDLDGDGNLETSYTDAISYYGYFDPAKCYQYDTPDGRFEPAALASGAHSHYCDGSSWSGNFLNWATMTRMDTVRKLLYGGLRSTDTQNTTVLERDFLPTDAHAFAKYYSGSDIARLTPFSNIATSVSPIDVTAGSATLASTTISGISSRLGANIGDQIKLEPETSSGSLKDFTRATYLIGYYSAANTVVIPSGSVSNPNGYASAGEGASYTNWKATNLSSTGISLCNLTKASANGALSQNANAPPVIRVAKGNYTLWGANEKLQCQWKGSQSTPYATYENAQSGFGGGLLSNGNRAYFSGLTAASENPSQSGQGLGSGSATGEYYARVQVCVSGLIGTERCKQYPNGDYKPIGLLQVYGEDGRIEFGLLSPSYQKNISGGVVRKNVGALTDEINATTDGTFRYLQTDASSSSQGIIYNIDKLKIYGYKYEAGNNYGDGDNCTYQLTGLVTTGGRNSAGQPQSEGNCRSWGNPIGEAYAESLRYFAGLSPTSAYRYGSSSADATLGLTVATTGGSSTDGSTSSWKDPLNTRNYCAALNVLTFNASVSSYDNDQLDISGLDGAPDAGTETKTVGDLEAITGNSYLVGDAAASANDLCDAKNIPDLSEVTGLCPEAPALKGSYLMAGAAYYAHTHRIRATLPNAVGGGTSNVSSVVPADDATSLKVETYGVQLATNTPKIVIPIGSSGGTVTILPVYRLDVSSNGSGPFGGGSIVDFKIVCQNNCAGGDGVGSGGTGTGKFYVNWEDSAQGGDYDQDMWGTISYVISGNTITVTTDAISASSSGGQGFGYIISGTDKDGPHFHSGIYNFDYADPKNVAVKLASGANPGSYINGSGGCKDCNINDPATSVTYTLGTTTGAGILQDPLWYAAKYGGYVVQEGATGPANVSQWDASHTDGSSGSDGIPDNYFYVSNPGQLESALGTALARIIRRTASGTAASVVANSREGKGAVYQALYEPTHIDSHGREVRWIGTVQALFVDDDGNLREDGDHDAALGDFAADPAVELFFDSSDRITKCRRYTGDPSGGTFTVHALSELRPIWNARDQLANLDDATIPTQRSYTQNASTGRYIFTTLDINLDGSFESSGTKPFTAATFSAAPLYRALNEISQTDAAKLVNYVRGQAQTGLRSREVDYDDSNDVRTMRLGDIVNSTPTVVGTPSESFDLLYNDKSYGTFRRRYQSRRNVVYVGANDGMLHAFNAGFYNPTQRKFQTTPVSGTGTAHPLGSELWAYVPFNLLPHLPWLADPDYNHAWYVDGSPRVFDARVFADDSTHPGGWGTVLVAGMRLGGTPITLQITGTMEVTMRSAYVVMDITDPESAPQLVAEISDPSLGYTTGFPTVTAFGSRNSGDGAPPSADKWYLIFGSGPDDSDPAAPNISSSGNGKLYMYDLKTRSFVTGYAPKDLGALAPTSFLGDPVSVDWDLDFKADALYFGSVGGSASNPSGKLFEIDFKEAGEESSAPADWTGPYILVDPQRPVVSTPSVTFDEQNNKWIFAGTGRFISADDKSSSQSQSIFGLIDYKTGAPAGGAAQYHYENFVDVTAATVETNGKIHGVSGYDNEDALAAAIGDAARTDRGWMLALPLTSTIAERSVSQTSLLGDVLFASTFTPSIDLCGGEGTSSLYGLYYKTGTAKAGLPIFGTKAGGTADEPYVEAVRNVSVGAGLSASPSLHLGGARDQRGLTIFTQTSTGAIQRQTGALAKTSKNGEIDWREMHQ
jgi:type IV pilus assembly protein PilY1